MIEKIISLKGIGRFEQFNASGDVSFKRYTLIFAENGVGKTTLCDIIRSLQTGDPSYIIGRRTLGSRVAPEAKILLKDGSTARFNNQQWSTVPPGGCTIFDASYVRRNIHAGEIVDIEHKRNLFQLIVGEEGVTLVERFNALEKERSDLNAPLRSSKAAVEAALPPGMKTGDFLMLERDPSIDSKIAEAGRVLAAARQQDQVRRHRALSPVVVPTWPAGLNDTLRKTLEGVSADAERRVQDHLAHLNYERGQQWIDRGVHLIRDEKCPFCAQSISANDLVAAYRACFSEAYSNLQRDVLDLQAAAGKALGDIASGRIETVLAQNDEALRFWSEFCDISALPAIDADEVKRVLAGANAAIGGVITRKAANILEAVDSEATLGPHLDALSAVGEKITTYNNEVEAKNSVIETRRQALSSLDATAAKTNLENLQAIKNRFGGSVELSCTTYLQLQAQRDQLDKEKAGAKTELDSYTDTVIRDYEHSLNKHLDNFLVGFRIKGTKAEFPRGYPSSSYQIVINDVAVDLGGQQTSPSEPSFQNTLSGGDRSALALSLFMAQLERATSQPEIAVILDDPFQSQDAFRKTATAFQIKRCGESCGQVIVLSHDPHFLKLVWDELPPDQRKSLRLHPVGLGTSMAPWDINETLKLEHQARVEAIQRYVSQGIGEARDVAQKLRPVLEAYCKIVCPDEFGDGVMIGDICRIIRETGTAHPLHAVLAKIEELNSFAKKYHHSNPNAAAESLSEVELGGYCRKMLSLMRLRAA